MHYDEVYDPITDYSMKCRLYLTKEQEKKLDDALAGVRVFHNCLVYDIRHNGMHLTEKQQKKKDGSSGGGVVHFPNFSSAFKKNYKDSLIKEHPIINACPQAALTTNVGLKADIKKEFGKSPIEYSKPRYYNELHPRRSYTYQESLNKIRPGDNPNVFHMDLNKLDLVKVRGWNQRLRFEDEETNFLQWAQKHPKAKVTITVGRDTVGDPFIVFHFNKNCKCLKPFPKKPNKDGKVGIDVGIKTLVARSDGITHENRRFKKQQKHRQRKVNRMLSRRQGPANEKFRDAHKEWKDFKDHPEKHAGESEPPFVKPSKSYLRTKRNHAKLNRAITRRRDDYNHKISYDLVAKHDLIAMESLSISGMVRNRHLSYALTDAAFGTLLSYIKYKAEWHGRETAEIGRWTPSSKRCSECGYIYSSHDEYHNKPWTLSIRKWKCPVCGADHGRDINAAKNILYYATHPDQIPAPT